MGDRAYQRPPGGDTIGAVRVLAGDIGGTKTALALLESAGAALHTVREGSSAPSPENVGEASAE